MLVVPARAADANRLHRESAAQSSAQISGVAAATHATAALDVERRGAERRCFGKVDREAALADEQLRGGDVDERAALERADGVDAAGRQVAEREREGAHDPQPVSEADDGRGLLGDETVSVASKERISIRSFGRTPPRAAPFEERPVAALGRPFLARAEVVDVAEDDVVHRVAVRDGDRERRRTGSLAWR